MSNTNPCDSELLTIDEAASLMRIKPATVRDWIWKKKIAYVKFSGRVFIRRSDVEALIQAGTVPAMISRAEKGPSGSAEESR